ncbi:hypothetical protein DFH09DRAFT_1479703 [Mycena vulgaris]|nr:hypothetical protein DFH09DRAFT_1479703 [Mycena vulgaris]
MSELSEPSELKPSEPDSSSVNEQAWIEDPMSLEDMNTDSKISIIHDKKRARFPIRLYKNGTGIAAQVHDCYPGEDDVKKKKAESRKKDYRYRTYSRTSRVGAQSLSAKTPTHAWPLNILYYLSVAIVIKSSKEMWFVIFELRISGLRPKSKSDLLALRSFDGDIGDRYTAKRAFGPRFGPHAILQPSSVVDITHTPVGNTPPMPAFSAPRGNADMAAVPPAANSPAAPQRRRQPPLHHLRACLPRRSAWTWNTQHQPPDVLAVPPQPTLVKALNRTS